MLWSQAWGDGLQNIAVLIHAGRGSNSIVAQFNNLMRDVVWIHIQESNGELQGDIHRGSVTLQCLDLLVARGNSVAAQFNDLRMVDMRQSNAVLQHAGCREKLHQDLV